jgi:hypothetical protein
MDLYDAIIFTIEMTSTIILLMIIVALFGIHLIRAIKNKLKWK